MELSFEEETSRETSARERRPLGSILTGDIEVVPSLRPTRERRGELMSSWLRLGLADFYDCEVAIASVLMLTSVAGILVLDKAAIQR